MPAPCFYAPGKELRLAEVKLAERTYAELGIPGHRTNRGAGDRRGGAPSGWTSGRWPWAGGYRTNSEGIRQLAALLAPYGIETITVDLPHWRGPNECLHLMSFISPIADRLADDLPATDVGPVCPGAATPRVVVHRGSPTRSSRRTAATCWPWRRCGCWFATAAPSRGIVCGLPAAR